MSFSERIKLLQRTRFGGNRDLFAKFCGVLESTVRSWENGTEPKLSMMVRVADACGVSLDWLAGNDEARPSALDEELFGRVTDAIQRLYQDERVSLAPIDLGRIAARKYNEIAAATADPAERGAMIKLIVTQLRAEIRSARAEPGTGKASA